MKVREIRYIQTQLAKTDIYTGELDGKRDTATDKAIHHALLARQAELPDDWASWETKRKAVACYQLLCSDSEINPGKIDGLYGPQTESASEQLEALMTAGERRRGFGDIVPIIANPNDFPIERQEALNAYYGKPCEIRLVKILCPWELRLDWDLNTTTKFISIHEKLGESLSGILQKIFDLYGPNDIRKHGLDRYGGSYNCRKKRGSLSAWSSHAWGIAIDWYPSKNKLKWDNARASLANADLDSWWEIWEREGWVSLGRSENRDWMHVQAARR